MKKLILSAIFLLLASPVFADTLTIYSSTADGNVGYNASSWSTARNAATGNLVASTETQTSNGIDARFYSPNYYLKRSFFYYDLSGVEGVVTDVTFTGRKFTNGTSVTIQQGTQAASLTTADYNNFTGTSFGSSSWASTFNTITMNAGGVSYINGLVGSGTAKICARHGNDYNNTTPANNTSVNGVYYAESGGSGTYLTLTISAAPAGNSLFYGSGF